MTTVSARRKTGTAADLDGLQAQIAKLASQITPKSKVDQQRDEVLARLDELAGDQLADSAVLFHGDKFVLPEVLDGELAKAVEFLDQIREAEETEFAFNRTFPYRPFDGAAAFQRAMLRVFGTVGIGRKTFSFFGTEPPQYISIPVAFGKNMQVPWGKVSFDPLKAVFQIGSVRTSDGPVSHISVTAPRKHRRRIEGFLTVVEDELRHRSIYHGQAIDAADDPGFIDLTGVSPDKVVYAAEARASLEANFWSVLEYAEILRTCGQPLKRAVLMEGPYGTGKTLTGVLTGQRAVAANWTFIQVRSGDDPYAALRTARLYSPCVVWIEDLDVHLAGKPREEVSKLLDALDSVNNKGAEVMVGFTTNFPDVLEKGVLRPGRIDAVVHFGALDPDGYENLIKAVIPAPMLGAGIDYKAVAAAFEGFVPAFAAEAAGRAIRYSLVRGNGDMSIITTQDLVLAGEGLRPQLAMLDGAGETRHSQVTMESILLDRVADVLRVSEVDGEPITVNR